MILLDSVTAFPADFLMIGYTVYITEIMSAARKNVPTQIADFIVIASVSGYKTPAAVGTPRHRPPGVRLSPPRQRQHARLAP